MILASIDIGSNTVLLLISKVNLTKKEFKTIANYYRVPRVSQGLKYGNLLTERKIEDLLRVLTEYNQICVGLSVEKIFVIATNAFRIAANSDVIVSRVKNELDLDIKIIDGETEARLSFLGSVYTSVNNQLKTVIDIGGGSTEIIYGNIETVHFKKSFQIGVVSLTEEILYQQPITIQDILKAENYVKKIFCNIPNVIPLRIETIAVAGTPTTLSCIKQGIRVYDELKVDNSILTYEEICKITKEITKLPPNKISERYGQVVEGREDVLLAGCIILKIVMKKLGISAIIVSSRGLRYGVIIDYILNHHQ